MMKGWKTIAVGLLMVIAPSALSYLAGVDWSQFVGPVGAFAISGGIAILMRVVTTTPVGKSSPAPIITSSSASVGGPSSQNAGIKGALVFFLCAGSLLIGFAPARAVDAAPPLPVPAPAAVTVAPKFSLPAFTPCTTIACTGWYGGFNIAGISTNVNVLAGGINGSLAAGGQNIGIQGGYQYWNGTFFFGPEVAIDYTYGGTPGPVAGQSSPRYLAAEIIKLGTPFATFFGSAPAPASTAGLSSILTANTIAPYIFFGAAQSGWGTTGMVGGAGVTFAIDQQHWFVDARYENYQFPSGASNCATGQSCPSINVVKVGLNYKF
jgi:opacity protein-like surface antigen